MNISLAFLRVFFMILCIFFMTVFMLSAGEGSRTVNAILGFLFGTIFSLLLYGFDTLFRRFNLRSFNVAVIGLFFGYLMGQALVLIFDAILTIGTTAFALKPQI